MERRDGALAGLVSVGAGLAVSELASGLLHQRLSPVVAVAEEAIALTPGVLIEAVIGLVGRHDKPLLIALTLACLAALGLLVGVLALRSLLAAELAFLAMGVVVVVAVGERLPGSTVTFWPAFAGVGVAMALLAYLTLRLREVPSDAPADVPADTLAGEPSAQPAVSRRRFLALSAAVAVGAVAVGLTGRLLARSRAAVEAARRALDLPVRVPRTPRGAEVGVSHVTPWITPEERFYRIDTALAVPQVLPVDWELRVHGMVDRELRIGYQDLLDRGLVDAWVTLCCVSNVVGGDLVGNARWSGVPVARVLDEAGVHPDADAVLSRSADGWTCGTPLSALTDGRNSLLAVAMNGEPLTVEHGFPVRMVVPGLYGYVSATKWVVDLEVSRFDDFDAFWTSRGWSEQGPVKLQSRIDVPGDDAHLGPGPTPVAGVSWAQHTGISAVEVRVDEGPWQRARLGADVTVDSWRQWVYVWQATEGDHRIEVRATDRLGNVQTGRRSDVVPDGATGWDAVTVHIG